MRELCKMLHAAAYLAKSLNTRESTIKSNSPLKRGGEEGVGRVETIVRVICDLRATRVKG